MTAQTLIAICLSNALAATVLAIVAFGVTRATRSAPVAHFLWVLVILKLLTPPLFEVRLPVGAGFLGKRAQPDPVASLHDVETIAAPGVPAATTESSETVDGAALEVPKALLSNDDPGALGTLVEPPARISPAVAVAPREPTPPMTLSPGELLILVWLSGSLFWYALAASRLLRFRRLLGQARPATEGLIEEVRLVALALGLKQVPEVLILSARVSPLIWALGGRARLVLPEQLASSLTAAQRKTLIAHEVAHLIRRDHWVRWVELLVLGLYWWFPVAWWARRALRAAEEECCDAWVQWVFPEERREYARTLLRTVDFLSRGPVAALEGASGMAQVSILERRFRMILHGRSTRRLPGLSRVALVCFAALVLPWAAGFTAGDEPEEAVASDEKEPLSRGKEEGIRISLDRDAKTGKTLLRVNDLATTTADLEDAVAKAKDESQKQGTEDPGIVIEAGTDVLWADVVKVMDVSKKEGLRIIELKSRPAASGKAPKQLTLHRDGRTAVVLLEGNEVSLLDDNKVTKWKTSLGEASKGAKVSVDEKGNLVVIGTPDRTVALDLATGKIVEERKLGSEGKLDLKGQVKIAGEKGEWPKGKLDSAAWAVPGAGIAGSSGPSAGSPVDVVQLGSALVEARGAARLAENRLSSMSSKEAVGVISQSERSAEEIQLHTAMQKINLLQRIAKSALNGTMAEIKALGEIEEMARKRYEDGQTGEDTVLSLTLRRVHSQTLASLLEELLRE
jgi:beta-lactamase regulating signal transducer with metallopeptidase domain